MDPTILEVFSNLNNSVMSCPDLLEPAGVTRATDSFGTWVQLGYHSSFPHPPREPAQAINTHNKMALKNKAYIRTKLERMKKKYIKITKKKHCN